MQLSIPQLFQRLLLISVMLLVSGCAAIGGAPPSVIGLQLANEDKAFADAMAKMYSSEVDTDQKRINVRNEFIETRLALIDIKYESFKQDLFSQRVKGNVASDIALTTLSVAGTAVTHENARTGLASVSSLISGSKASIDKNVYFDQTLPSLIAQMDATRSKISLGIFKAMALDTKDYSLAMARRSLSDYTYAGTIPGAITAVAQQAATDSVAATKAVDDHLKSAQEIKNDLLAKGFEVTTFSDSDVTKLLSQCTTSSKSAGDNRKEIKAWLAAHPNDFKADPAVAIAEFLGNPKYEALRKIAVSDAQLRTKLKDCALPGEQK